MLTVVLSFLIGAAAFAGGNVPHNPKDTESGPDPRGVSKPTSVSVVDLRTEYLVAPLGLDVPQPRLSWRMETADAERHGLRQTKYRIIASSIGTQLEPNKADLWDSGWVESDQSNQIPYEGKPLLSNQQVWWKVQIVDEHGLPTHWSDPANWTMGYLHKADWKAKWIGTDIQFGHAPKSPNYITKENDVVDPWLRKDVDLPSEVTRAVVYVASVGYHELYVNGVRAGDEILAPSVSDNGKRARYVTYEVGHLLKPGKNVLALWLGTSWSIFPHFERIASNLPFTPIAMGQAEIWLSDGSHQTVVTDESWKTHPSTSRLLGVWDFMNYGGEEINANNDIPDWSLPSLDDSTWQSATVYHPNLAVSAEKLEPNRQVHELVAHEIKALPDGSFRVDMGQNFAGWVSIPVQGKPGDQIQFEFSERADSEITHKLRSTYIIGPSGSGVFKNRFNYSVGRWITIKGLQTQPKSEQIHGWLVRSDFERAATFECSNLLLNQIYDMTLWTFENLSLGGYVVDCPQRERMGYGGDAHATTQAALNNYHMGAFYNKWAEDWRDVQGVDGSLPYTAPTYWGGGGPAWMGFTIFMPWEVYLRYGDKRLLEQQYPTMKRWLAFMETHAKDDLLVRWGGDWDFLGDWLWPTGSGINGDTPETLCFNNCYWVYALRLAAKVSDTLGEKEGAAYRARADTVSAAINARLYHAETSNYGTGDQQYLASALLAEVPSATERPKVWKRLEDEILVHRKGHIWAGILGGSFLTRLLLDSGRADLLYPMAIQHDFPSYGDFIAKGHTTFPEEWDGNGSQLHSSFLFSGTWFIEGFAGIRQAPNQAGFQHFEIRPLIPTDLDNASATYDSPYGRIASSWFKKDGHVHLTVTVPPNSTAQIVLPTTEPVKMTGGITQLVVKDGKTTFQIGQGTYSFAY
jgi:alpha-L-rhamnosidase